MADKRLFRKRFQSKGVSQNHLRGILVSPTAQIVSIFEAWTGLACLKRSLMNWLLTEFQIHFQSGAAVKAGSRKENTIQLSQWRKCSPCCTILWINQTAPNHLIKPWWCCNISFVARELSGNLYRPTHFRWRLALNVAYLTIRVIDADSFWRFASGSNL